MKMKWDKSRWLQKPAIKVRNPDSYLDWVADKGF